MVDENLTDEQQADIIRQWLRENSLFIFGGLGLGLLSLFGWDQWQTSKKLYAEEASSVYQQLVGKIQVNNLDEAESLLARLLADYDGTPYVDHARFRLAKMSLDRNNFDAGASYLESIVAESGSVENQQIASIRLARIRLQQEQYDAALSALEQVDTDSAFYAQVNAVRGDIYFVMDRGDDALAAYDAALTDTRQPPTIDRAFVQAKRDSLDIVNLEVATELGIDASNPADDASAATE